MEDSVARVALSAPGGENTDVLLEKAGPGLFRATIDVKTPGLYKLQTTSTSGPLTAVAHAGIEDAREMNEVVATADKMKPIADATGGGVFWTRGGGTAVVGERRSMCRASRCCRARACWPAPAGSASRTARRSSPAASR